MPCEEAAWPVGVTGGDVISWSRERAGKRPCGS